MLLTVGAMVVWPKKQSDWKEMKKAYCGFTVALRRPTWKSRGKKLKIGHQIHAYAEEAPPRYVDAATDGSSGELPPLITASKPTDPLEHFNQLRAGGSCVPSSTSMVGEGDSGNTCKE
jgi:hypothetical protein